MNRLARTTLLAALVALFILPDATAQTRDVAFVHGLFGDEGSWSDTRSLFDSEFDIRSYNQGYDSKDGIAQIGAGYGSGIPDGSIYVGHSMGGLVSRSVFQQQGSGRIDALVTLGTPHTGAPLAANTGRIDDVADDWIDGLAAGPSYQYGGLIGGTLAAIASEFVEGALSLFEGIVSGTFDSIRDLQPGSRFLQDLGTTRPAVTYAVWSREDPNALWRLGDASFSDAGVETGSGIEVKEDALAYYTMMFATAQSNAQSYYDKYRGASWWNVFGKTYYWSLYSYWSSVAAGYHDGVEVLATRIDQEWERDVVGVGANDATGSGYVREVSDGVVPFSSQAPSFVPPEFRLSARGVNHLEQVNNAETRSRLRYVLRQLGVEGR